MARLFLLSFLVLPVAGLAQTSPVLSGTYIAGPIAISFDSGRHEISRGGQIAISGRHEIRGDSITFYDVSGPIACHAAIAGRYLWLLSGSQLSFTLIDDGCDGRKNAMPGRTWTRQATVELALVGATLTDGTGASPRPAMTILIADSRIVDVFPDGAKPIPAGAVVRDLRGRYVIPGLIDTHVHLATDPSGDDSRNRAEVRLRHTLLGGVTSVRDMAGDARALADLARAAKVGDIVSPRIYYSALFAGPEFFTDPRVVATSRGETVGQVPWALAVTAKTDWRLAVAQARGTGASGIKLYAALSGDLLAPLVTEAHAQGMRVWAHASLMPARPGELVKAGVDVLSHTPLVAREADTVTAGYRERYRVNYASIPATHPAMERLAGEMAAARTIVEATLFVFFGRDSTSPPARWAAMMTGTLQRRGVTIVAGTDGMIGVEGDSLPAPGTLPNLHRELELLVHHAGLTPHQAILAATSDAARAIGIDSLVGTVTPGKLADLLVLTADPLANISNTRKIEFVVAAGKVVE